MRQHGPVGRAAVGDDAGQQRAVEPAPVLVRAFQVQIGGPPLARLEHRGIAHPGFEPDVEDVALFLEIASAAVRAGRSGRQQVGRRPFEPDVGAVRLHHRGDVIDDDRIGQYGAAARTGEPGNRHAPDALA